MPAHKEKKEDQDGESADEQDIQNQLEDHFEGVGKKNTRKKKNKGQNNAADLMAAAFDEGADSDEVHAKKGGKKDKKDKKEHQGKRKNKNKNRDSDDEAQQEESKIPEDKEETKEQLEPSSSGPPLEVIYCKSKLIFLVCISSLFLVLGCGLPPEYCSFGQKDISACKEWLKETHPDLFSEIYPDDVTEACEAKEEKKAGEEGEGNPDAPK